VILMVGMLVAGTINTIVSKVQDDIHSAGKPGSGALAEEHPFDHPTIQTLSMFFGECLCMIAYLVVRSRQSKSLDDQKPSKFPFWTFAPAAMCDMIGTTIMYIGLILTYPSVYQMLRGSSVVFTGLFSRIFLKRVLYKFHYFAMAMIVVGTFVVGLSSVINDNSPSPPPNPLLGDLLVVAAQVVGATQMVVEEKFIGRYNVHPLQVVGNEGLYGASVLTVLMFVFYFIIPIRNRDDSLDAIFQIRNNTTLLLALLGSILSIAFFNYFGISVTKHLSATHRTTIDASRVFLVWLASLLIGWERFEWLQLVGFVVLLCGTSIFNEVVRLPFFAYPPTIDYQGINDSEKRPLLNDE